MLYRWIALKKLLKVLTPWNKGYQLLILRNLSEVRVTLQLSQMKRKIRNAIGKIHENKGPDIEHANDRVRISRTKFL